MAANLPAVLAAMGGIAGAYFAYRGSQHSKVAVQQNEEIKQQGKEMLQATNGIQAVAIEINRKDAAAEAVLGERERVADKAVETRLEEIRGHVE